MTAAFGTHMKDPCFNASDKMITADEAVEFLLAQAHPTDITEIVATGEALGRVLAISQTSKVTVPPADNSAMDGYAVSVADCSGNGSTCLHVAQRIPAGVVGKPLVKGTAARIFTGAPVPPGADAVVMQEFCEQNGDEVVIKHTPLPGENIRRAGEDIREGEVVLEAGSRLRPQDMGLAASVGLAKLPVYKRLRVGIFSTGDELVAPGEPLGPGQIYNSNRYTLTGLLQTTGCDIIDLGTVEDTLDATRKALQQAASQADLIVTTGGVSVGEEDYIKHALQQLGKVEMWRVAMKPGKPLAYGHVGDTAFIGLPGNPVSVFATFLLFARPYILKRQGVRSPLPLQLRVKAMFEWKQSGPRREFVRARMVNDPDGNACAELYPSQSSGVLMSTVWANGLVVIPEHTTVDRNDPVTFIPFSELLA